MTRIAQFLIRVNPTGPRPDGTLVDRLKVLSETMNRTANADSTGAFVAVPGATRGTAHADLMAEAPFDAIIELRGADMSIALPNRERMAPIIDDELRFIDHANSVVGFYRAI